MSTTGSTGGGELRISGGRWGAVAMVTLAGSSGEGAGRAGAGGCEALGVREGLARACEAPGTGWSGRGPSEGLRQTAAGPAGREGASPAETVSEAHVGAGHGTQRSFLPVTVRGGPGPAHALLARFLRPHPSLHPCSFPPRLIIEGALYPGARL